jgi:uncharacterized protein (UPF0332 family)
MGGSVSTIQLVTIAQAAYRTNGNQLLRESKDGKVANIALVKAQIDPGASTKIELLPEDATKAEEIKNYILQRVMLSRLTNKALGDFIENIGVLLDKDQVNAKHAGILAWVPKVYADLTKADDQQNEMYAISRSSRYIGKVGDKVEIDFTTITKRWNNNYGCFRYTGHDSDGNLVGFLSKNDYPAQVKIKGRIKATEESKYTNGRTTYINYTRELK